MMPRLNVTSSSLVYSHTLRDLYMLVSQSGWSLKKIKYDKKEDCYVASAKNAFGDEIEKTGPDEEMATRNLVLAIQRKNHMRSAAMERIGMWRADWTDQLQPIAEAYAKAPVYDPKAAAAFKELADDSMRRAEVLRNQLHIEETNDPEPYPHAQAMADDIHKRQHFIVSKANSEHPLWTPEQNVAFRTVHDVLGHAVSGGDFGWEGENKACFVPGTLIRTDCGYKTIEEIKIGDWVLSANGQYNKVYAVMERDYDGEIVEIETTSTVAPIIATTEHPFKRLHGSHRTDRTRPCMPGWCNGHNVEHVVNWTAAGDLRKGEWLSFVAAEAVTLYETVGVPQQYRGRMRACKECRANRGANGPCAHKTEYVGGRVLFDLTNDFLWAIGLYLAEGSSGTNQIIFSLHKEEIEYQERLKRIFKNLGYEVNILPHSTNGVEVQVRSAILSRWFPEWLGRGSHNKAIPFDLLELPIERLKHIAQGIFDGDGTKKNSQLGQTSSILALQIMEISHKLGNDPTISVRCPHNKKTIYTVDEVLEPRVRNHNKTKKGIWNIADHSLRQITKIDRKPYRGKVYNLSVENDETYVVQNIAVHNCAAHFPLLSAEAQKALFTECIAQTAYGAHYRHFGPQKVALFPQFYEPAQKAEGVHPNFQGIHPSQSVAPKSMPAIKPSKPVGLPKDNVAPHEQEAQGLPVSMNYVPGVDIAPRTGSVLPGQEVDPTLADPNAGYQTGIDPMPINAYLHHGDPLQAQETMHNASLIDTEWAKLKTGENKPDFERMKLAIVNAFRAVLLSPRKDLYWNTIHYQDISGVPPGTTDPSVYWNTLENKRQAWNVKNFGENARFAHRPYFKLLPLFERSIYDRNPQAGWEAAKERAQREMLDWEQEEQERIMEADEQLPEDARMNHFEVEKEANKALAKKIEVFLAEHKAYDQPNLFTAAKKEPTQEDSLFPLEPQVQQPKLDRYGAFMGTHLKAIAQVSTHVDALLKAALEDVHEHDGSGHHFRAAVLQLGVPGVGPKVASFAWLLLQPTTSQLATIDTHMMDVLGKNYDKEMSTRDYFARERELQAGRDAAGYGHLPLGAFQWGLWDFKRGGEGSHQDHSGLRVLNPVPYDAIDWQEKEQPSGGAQAMLHKQNWHSNSPDWWKNTEPYRKQVGEEWDASIDSPRTQVPFQTVASVFKTAAVLRTPWIEHPQSGERLTGQPGETLMAHAVNTLHLSTPEIWTQVSTAGKS